MAYSRAIMHGARPGLRMQSPPPPPPPQVFRRPRPVSSPSSRRAAPPPPSNQPPPPPPQPPTATASALHCGFFCPRKLEMVSRMNLLARRSYSSCAINQLFRDDEPLSRTPTSEPRRPVSTSGCRAQRQSCSPPPPLAEGWTRCKSDQPCLSPVPTNEPTSRYAQVPTVYSVIKSFSKRPPWSPPMSSAHGGFAPCGATVHDMRRPSWSMAGFDAAGYGERDDDNDWRWRKTYAPLTPAWDPSPAPVPRFPDLEPQRESALGEWWSSSSWGASTASLPVPSQSKSPVPSPVASPVPSRWSLAGALRRVRAFLGSHAREPLSSRELRYRKFSPADKVPFFYPRRAIALRRELRDEDDDEEEVLQCNRNHYHSHSYSNQQNRVRDLRRDLRSASLSGIARSVKFFTVTKRCGAVILSSFTNLRPLQPEAGVAPASSDAALNPMPECPAQGEYCGYDESCVYEERGGDSDRDEAPLEGDAEDVGMPGGPAYDYCIWKQDPFAPLPPSLARCRPQSEFPSRFRGAFLPATLPRGPSSAPAANQHTRRLPAPPMPLCRCQARPASASASASRALTAAPPRALSDPWASAAEHCVAQARSHARTASAAATHAGRREGKMLGHGGSPRSDLARVFHAAACHASHGAPRAMPPPAQRAPLAPLAPPAPWELPAPPQRWRQKQLRPSPATPPLALRSPDVSGAPRPPPRIQGSAARWAPSRST